MDVGKARKPSTHTNRDVRDGRLTHILLVFHSIGPEILGKTVRRLGIPQQLDEFLRIASLATPQFKRSGCKFQ